MTASADVADVTFPAAFDGAVARVRTVRAFPLAVAMFVIAATPLVIALVHLSRERWYPVLDLAMTELRVRDVGTSHTPTIGLPGRIGDLPDQGSHPGPISFWVLAPVYRLLGQTAYSLEVGTVIVHLVVIALIVWCGWRVAGRTGIVLAGAMVVLLTRGYGTELLIQPWNPYFPLLAWLLVLWATVAVLAGHHRWIIAVVVAGTFGAQTHIPYLMLAIGMCALCFGVVGFRAWRGDREHRRGELRTMAVAGGIGLLVWLPSVLEELFGSGEGNISRLIDHFGSPPEKTLGFVDAWSILLRHLNVWEASTGLVHGSQGFMWIGLDDRTPRWPGAIALVVWIVAAVVGVRIGSPRLRALHAVVGVGLVLSLVSIARIFGVPWFYLTLWTWSITALLVVAVLATVRAALRQWRPSLVAPAAPAAPAAVTIGLLVVAWSTIAFSIEAKDAEHAEEHLSEELGPLVRPTYDAVIDGVGAASGPDGRYVVRWTDAHFFGSQAYGLLNELDRLGLDVGADPYFAVPATEHRVFLSLPPADPAERAAHPVATAQVHLATGGYIDQWRQVPDAVEVATVDLRTPEEREKYGLLRMVLIDELTSDGLVDKVPEVDTNIFGLSDDPQISPAAREAASEMLQIGTELAVFIAPPTAAPR